jgi:hypothetical protein
LTDLIAAEHHRPIDEIREKKESAEPPREKALVD